MPSLILGTFFLYKNVTCPNHRTGQRIHLEICKIGICHTLMVFQCRERIPPNEAGGVQAGGPSEWQGQDH